MLDKDTIMREAIDRCLSEMFEKAQPRANWHEYLEMAKRGEISKDENIYERHYLSDTEFNYIANKYKKAYGFKRHWKDDCDWILHNLKEGGYRDAWIKDEDGDKHRESEKTKPLNELIGDESAEKVYQLIEDFKDFYRFDREESVFDFNVYLGCSPTSNVQTVIDYWKSVGVDIEIDEKKDLTEDDFWEIDMYGHKLEDEGEKDSEETL